LSIHTPRFRFSSINSDVQSDVSLLNERTVLIVDDCERDCAAFRRYLTHGGDTPYCILVVASAKAAIEYLRHETPGCILLDFHLPDMDGLALLAVLKDGNDLQRFPVVMMTAIDTAAAAVSAMKLGALDCLVKGSITAETLVSAIDNAVDRHFQQHRLEARREELQRKNAEMEQLILVLGRDVTDRKQAEATLQASAARLDEAQRIAKIGSWEFEFATRKITWSKELFRLAGIPPEQGEPDYPTNLTLYAPEDAARLDMYVQRAARQGIGYKLELRSAQSENESLRWYHEIGKPMFDAQGNVVRLVGTIMDITERKQADKALNQRTEELIRSNTDLEQFAYMASHDLQEPLRMIGSYLELLGLEYSERLDDEAREYIAYAVDGAVRMKCLINDLLAYSRVGTQGKPMQPTSVSSLLAEVLADLQLLITETNAVITSDSLPTVSADGSQLRLVLQNLIGNAIKFRGAEAPRVHISAAEVDGEWRFSIHDNGIGIKTKHTERIFVIFQQLHGKNKYGGTGIGLSTCKRVVERHGGRIWVESEPGTSSTFFFTLPHTTATGLETQAAHETCLQ
jgi:PAS domain S-box-containing protein